MDNVLSTIAHDLRCFHNAVNSEIQCDKMNGVLAVYAGIPKHIEITLKFVTLFYMYITIYIFYLCPSYAKICLYMNCNLFNSHKLIRNEIKSNNVTNIFHARNLG